MTGLFLALRFLTRFPVPAGRGTDTDFGSAVRWFPAAGLVIGVWVASLWALGGLVSPWMAALLALVGWIRCTGALHLDGLADITDAAGAMHKSAPDPEHILAILRDPHLGSFGAVALVLQILAKLLLLHELAAGPDDAAAFAGICLIPFAARIAPLAWARLLPPLHEGLGALFKAAADGRALLFWGVVLSLAAWFMPPLVLTPVAIWTWHHRLKRSFGGINGDGHGAGIELTESLLLLSAVVWRSFT